MIKGNLHTHTIFSDGKNTPEQMINRAIELNFDYIGFSEHSDDIIEDDDCVMKESEYEQYFDLLDSLKEKYKKSIKIYKGLELDSFCYTPKVELDYSIGSIHYLQKDGIFYPLDLDSETLRDIVGLYGGTKVFLQSYFEDMINFAKTTPYNILGHFDLFTKFNERDPLFDINDKDYIDMATNVLEEIIRLNKIIEINTGAISRGYRTSFYPSLSLFNALNDLKAPMIVSSDSHSISTINSYFEETESILQNYNNIRLISIEDII